MNAGKKKFIKIQMREKQIEAIDDLAGIVGMSRSALIRALVALGVERVDDVKKEIEIVEGKELLEESELWDQLCMKLWERG